MAEIPAALPPAAPIVTSGDSDEGIIEDGNHSDDDDSLTAFNGASSSLPAAVLQDELYDQHQDEQDEAYVNKHLRANVGHPTNKDQEDNQLQPGRSATNQNQRQQQQEGQRQPNKIVKPANSDAVLSCPCCFSVVCMDCQQHDRYPNQYRAMFVMNIVVRWDQLLQYDGKKGLIPYTPNNASSCHHDGAAPIPPHDDPSTNVPYYTVRCASCQTHVASLDMTDEVYHFYGCLASA